MIQFIVYVVSAFFAINLATGAEVERVEIFYQDFWSTTALPLSSDGVISLGKKGEGANGHFVLKGKILSTLLKGVAMQTYLDTKVERRGIKHEIDCRIVFQFFSTDGTYRQLDVGAPLTSSWHNIKADAPSESELRKLIALLPDFLAKYSLEPEGFFKKLGPGR